MQRRETLWIHCRVGRCFATRGERERFPCWLRRRVWQESSRPRTTQSPSAVARDERGRCAEPKTREAEMVQEEHDGARLTWGEWARPRARTKFGGEAGGAHTAVQGRGATYIRYTWHDTQGSSRGGRPHGSPCRAGVVFSRAKLRPACVLGRGRRGSSECGVKVAVCEGHGM